MLVYRQPSESPQVRPGPVLRVQRLVQPAQGEEEAARPQHRVDRLRHLHRLQQSRRQYDRSCRQHQHLKDGQIFAKHAEVIRNP